MNEIVINGGATLTNNANVTLVLSYRIFGDVNSDGVVNVNDLALVTSHMGQDPTSPGWDPNADVNSDGIINATDVAMVTANFGQQYKMRISQDDPNFTNICWRAFTSPLVFTLTGGDGKKVLYVQFCDTNYVESAVYSTPITLDMAPPVVVSFTISDDAASTNQRLVDLKFVVTGDPASMQIFNEIDFTDYNKLNRPFVDFKEEMKWLLSPTNGQKTVLVRFMDAAGNVSDFAKGQVLLDTRAPIAPKILTPTNFSTIKQRIVEVTGTAEPGSVVIVTVENID